MVEEKLSASNFIVLSDFADWSLQVAPMLDCTNRHFRYLMRGITRKSILYTEMVSFFFLRKLIQ